MRIDQTDDDCTACHGLGQKVDVTPARFAQPLPPYRECAACKGTGRKPRPAEEAS